MGRTSPPTIRPCSARTWSRLDVATLGPEGELLRSIDIYAVEKDGPRLLSWHRNWDMPYMITGFRSAH